MVSPLFQITNFLHRHHRCMLCRLPVDTPDQHWCQPCLARFPRTPYCHGCGTTTLTMTEYCGRCLTRPPPWQRCYRLGEYRFPLRQLVHKFKFGHQFWLARPLGTLLAQAIPEPAPLLLPVPLHPWRQLTRSFNQSTLLATAIAEATGSRCQPDLLRRTRHNPAQHQLNKAQRQTNLRDAFRLRKPIVRPSSPLPSHVALVDDVVTTGSTLSVLTRLLLAEGVERVDIYCLCYTPAGK
ncbi:amidophosphoribosyltransferase [Photobacterium ganghwense]|nr:phosphoribosyltransferase family protein [Photobacterium ganghwense]PSU06264.1 amidophosphoribosyltransferase [Photobacterium ganghwense]